MRSPGLNPLTFTPACTTVPTPSWPMVIGSEDPGNSPSIIIISEWHSDAEPILTSTSFERQSGIGICSTLTSFVAYLFIQFRQRVFDYLELIFRYNCSYRVKSSRFHQSCCHLVDGPSEFAETYTTVLRNYNIWNELGQDLSNNSKYKSHPLHLSIVRTQSKSLVSVTELHLKIYSHISIIRGNRQSLGVGFERAFLKNRGEVSSVMRPDNCLGTGGASPKGCLGQCTDEMNHT